MTNYTMSCVSFVTVLALVLAVASNAQPVPTADSDSGITVKATAGPHVPTSTPLFTHQFTSPTFNKSSITPKSTTSYSYYVYFPSGSTYSGLWRAGISSGSESIYAAVSSTSYSSSNGYSLTEYLTPYTVGYGYSTIKSYSALYFYSVYINIYSTYYVLTGYVYYA